MVDHRTQQTSHDLDYYYFVKPPPERNSSNPLGVHVDGKIMPQRDIDDTTNGTQTWMELHGVDLYFAYEGALERTYAAHQFDGRYVNRGQHVDEPYPTSVPIVNITQGKIEGYPWQYAVGNWHTGVIETGIGDCFARNFLNIEKTSDLKDSYTEWPDGSEIEYRVHIDDGTQEGVDYNSWEHPYWAMGGFMPPMGEQDPQKSDVNDFASNQPLSADNVRKAYWDLKKLRFYTLPCPTTNYAQDTTNGYNQIIKAEQWRTSSHNEEHMNPPQPPSPADPRFRGSILLEDNYYFSTDPVQRSWEKHEISNGTYRFPYCGKYGRGQGYKSLMYGSEVAMYAAFHLAWRNEETYWETKERVGFYKVAYAVRQDVGMVVVQYSEVLSKAKNFANHYNARIPQAFPTASDKQNYCEVELIDLFSVCQIGSRTDISSLDWKWSPNKNQ